MLLSFFHIRSPPQVFINLGKRGREMKRIFQSCICVIRVGTLVFTIKYGKINKEGGSSCDDR